MVRRQKLSDEVRRGLLELIKSGAVGLGQPLPSERELMEQFGVGRPAIREAMQSLETIGLIEIRHGGRARVSEPSIGRMVDQISETMKHLLANSPASLENLKEARATIEREMARIAARRRSVADLERLSEILAEQSLAADDAVRFRMLDGFFHSEVARISGNPIFSALIDALFRWLADFHVDLVSVPGLEQLTLAEHQDILAAITRADAEGAARRDGRPPDARERPLPPVAPDPPLASRAPAGREFAAHCRVATTGITSLDKRGEHEELSRRADRMRLLRPQPHARMGRRRGCRDRRRLRPRPGEGGSLRP